MGRKSQMIASYLKADEYAEVRAAAAREFEGNLAAWVRRAIRLQLAHEARQGGAQ